MSKQEDDILQIRKYLNGELDARAMHKLERRAQDDPFLMDALAGYEAAGTGQDKNLKDLTERLQHRTEKKERRIIAWRFAAIAASIFLFLTIGVVWYINREPVVQLKTAKIATPPIKKPDTIPAIVLEKKTEIAKNELAKLKPKYSQQAYVAPAVDNIAANAKPKANATKSEPNADVTIDEPVGNSDAKVMENAPNTTVPLNELVVTNYAAEKKKQADSTSMLAKDRSAGTKTITGLVKDLSDNQPLPGATVKVTGTNLIAQTNANGKFILKGIPDNASLEIAYIGYNQQKVNVNKRDSLNIALSASNNSLSEVVVTGYGTSKKDEDAVSEDAHPTQGWNALRKYLKDNAIASDGKNGKVRLSFMVDGNGLLSDFKVLKSLSKAADEKAIELMENGPVWTSASDKKPQQVKISIRFK